MKKNGARIMALILVALMVFGLISTILTALVL